MNTAAHLLIVAAAASALGTSVTACQRDLPASSPPPSATPSGEAVASKQPADDPARALTSSECASLGQWLVDDCQNRSDQRSAQVDGWCSDLIRGVQSGSWTKDDCAKHIKYMDYVCFRSTTSVRNLMDCDGAVQRP
jgi:hypothetical protein